MDNAHDGVPCAEPPHLGHVSDRHHHVAVGHEGHAAAPVVVGARAPVVDEYFLGPACDRRGVLVKVDLHPYKPVVLLAEKWLNQAVVAEPATYASTSISDIGPN